MECAQPFSQPAAGRALQDGFALTNGATVPKETNKTLVCGAVSVLEACSLCWG